MGTSSLLRPPLASAGADQTVEPPAFEAPEFAPPQPPAGPGQEDRQAAERDFARAHDGAAAAIALLATARVGPICPPATPQIESGQNSFHYIHLEGVCFLCLAERSYPKRLAFRCPQGLGSLAVGYPRRRFRRRRGARWREWGLLPAHEQSTHARQERQRRLTTHPRSTPRSTPRSALHPCHRR